MKRTRSPLSVPMLVLLAAACFLVAGCGLTAALDAFEAANPASTIVAHDRDGDGVPDAYLVADAAGVVQTDPATGEAAEVPGTREAIDKAKTTDASIAGLLATLGACGVPFATYVGKKWGQAKPAQRAAHYKQMFAGLVDSVQALRKGEYVVDNPADASAAVRRQIDAALDEVQRVTPGLIRAVHDVKAELKGEFIDHAEAGGSWTPGEGVRPKAMFDRKPEPAA